jgi:hypothetical protein
MYGQGIDECFRCGNTPYSMSQILPVINLYLKIALDTD